MVKKILAQIVLAIFINILILPVSFAIGEPEGTSGSLETSDSKATEDTQTSGIGAGAAKFLSITTALDDLKPCINEYKRKEDGSLDPNPEKPDPGPDSNYVISIIEEPLNVEPKGTTPADTYVVRACFRNTFQYYNLDDKKMFSESSLAASCSQKAQTMLENGGLKEYRIKYSCKEVMVILTKGGTTAIYGYINLIYRWGAGMVGIIAVTIIVASGIQISASGGDSEAIGSAKKRILQSIMGIVVLFLSSLILYTINPNFFTI